MTPPLNVAVNLDLIKPPFDPLNNPTLSNAFFVNNLYGNLVEASDDGGFKPDLAKSFSWIDNNLVFEFDESSSITAEDALFNIKRTLYSNSNDHADIWYLLCDEKKDISSCFNKITVSENKLFIHVDEPVKQPLLLPLLSSINYKIVPVTAFGSQDSSNAKIVDYSVTSGHYHLKNNSIHTLYANPKTISEYPQAPTTLNIINTNTNTIEKELNLNSIDIVSTTIPLTEKVASKLLSKGWNIFETFPISVGMIVFSDSAIKKTAVAERFSAAALIKKHLDKARIYKSTDSVEFFQYFGEGYISPQQKNTISDLRKSSKRLSQTLTMAVGRPDAWEDLNALEPKVKIISSNGATISNPESTRPDVFIITNDVSFDTSFSMFSFAAKIGILRYENFGAEDLISEFINKPSREERINFINKVHFYSLEKCKIYPIWSTPYFTAAKEGIKINLSKYNSRTLLWKLAVN